MLNFVQNFQYYMMFEVIEPNWQLFESNMDAVRSNFWRRFYPNIFLFVHVLLVCVVKLQYSHFLTQVSCKM